MLSTLTGEVFYNVILNRVTCPQRRIPLRCPTTATSFSVSEPITLVSGYSTVTSSFTSSLVWTSCSKLAPMLTFLPYPLPSRRAETTYPQFPCTLESVPTVFSANYHCSWIIMLTKCKFMFVLCDVYDGCEVFGSSVVVLLSMKWFNGRLWRYVILFNSDTFLLCWY